MNARGPRVLNVFNRYRERGGEELFIEKMEMLLSERVPLETCRFHSADWAGPSAPPAWDQARRMFWNPDSLRTLRATHAAFKPDAWVFHNIFPVGSAALYREALRQDIPLIQYCHNFRPFSTNGYLWVRDRINSAALRGNFLPEILAGAWQDSRLKTSWAALVLSVLKCSGWLDSVRCWVAPSKFLRDRLIEAGIPAARVEVLPHFTPTAGPTTPLLSGTPSFLYLGRLAEPKGIPIVLDAARVLAASNQTPPLRITIAGDGPMRPAVEAAAAASPLLEYAGFVGPDLKQTLIRNATAVLMPSVCWETFGLAAQEALLHGRPVLCADSGALPELVRHSENGLVHRAGNAEELAAHMRALASDAGLAARLAAGAAASLENMLGPSAWLERFLEIINRATSRQSP